MRSHNTLPTRRCRRRLLPRWTAPAGLLALLATSLLAAPLRAQTDGGDPYALIDPGTGTFTSPSVAVTVRFSDNASIKTTSRSIIFNGNTVTSQFTHSAVTTSPIYGVTTTSTKTLTLQPGVNTLKASVCDNAPTSTCSDTTIVTYTYVSGRPAVRVSPDGGALSVAAWTDIPPVFRVVNPGTAAGTYRLRPECRDAWTGAPHSACFTTSPATVSVGAGDSASVTVMASGVAPGRVLLVRLSAELESMPGVADAGWVDVNVTGSAGTTATVPVIQLADLTTGAYPVLRSQCATASAGPGVAYECGDLRLAHGLPAHRTLNRTWAPVLMYNSRHADPRPSVYLDVTLPVGMEVPSTMTAVIYFPVSGHVVQAPFAGSEWQPGTTRRIAVEIDPGIVGWQTAYYAQVLAATSQGQPTSNILASQITSVDRTGSGLGPGWWLAGVEHLICTGCASGGSRMLVVEGDGSTRIYEPLSSWQTWVSQNPDGAPDTLTLVGYSYYVRKLPDGSRVEFDGAGQHVRTINRLGQVTTFEWTNGRLTRVVVPTGAGTAPAYDFVYDANGVLTSINATAPGAATRTVTLGHELGDKRITYIQDPDGKRVNLAYTNTRPRLVTRRTDRRGTHLDFTYSTRGRLTSTRLGLASGDSIISGFEPVEDKGFGQSVPLAQAYTALDGPRTDVVDRTLIWTDERGASRRVRDALGAETLVTRGDTRFPALVTQVRAPNARGDSLVLRTSAGYDARGRITADTVHNPLGDGVHRVTTYGWDDAVDRPAWIKAPGADTVRLAYDPVTRNALWQQQGGSARRVHFDYNTRGQVIRVRYPHPVTGAVGGGGRDSLTYDAVGNLKRTWSPLGFVTLTYRDALGRVVETVSPVHAGSSSDSASVASTGLRRTVAYDVMDRDTLTVTYGRAMTLNRQSSFALVHGTPVETLTVRTTYDDGGLPLKVRRWSTPDSAQVGVLTESYEYDRAGRRVAEGDSVAGFNYYTYDLAGNLVQHLDPRMYAFNTTFDAAGRMTRRVVPSVLYEPEDVNCADLTWTSCSFHFPSFPNAANGRYMVRADTALFSYDAAGNMVRAENGDAIVSRTYYPGGALATDSLRIRTWDRSQSDLHAFGIAYGYDAAGRVSSLEHPRNLTGGVAQSDQFRYDPLTSALDSVVSRTGLRFGYQQDLLGRVVRDTFPGGYNTYRYDLGGRRTGRQGAYVDSLTYDARGKVLSAVMNSTSTSYNHYSGLGNLVATEWRNDHNAAQEVDEYRLDALGHTVWTRSVREGDGGNHPEYRYAYDPGQSRIKRIYNVLPASYVDSLQFTRDTTYRTYDEAGNVEMGSRRSWRTDIRKVQTRPYFGADGQLRAEQGYEEMNGTPYMVHERRGYFSEHRYDALGRRVLVRTRRDGLCYKASSTIADCTGGITRYVWAGDNLLWEMRGPGADSVAGARLNELSATAQEFGVVGYTHAAGVDRPLVVWKGMGSTPGVVVAPHMNWRGLFGKGTTSTGAVSTEPIVWPGFKTTAYHRMGPGQQTTTNWMGSLIGGQRDPGGNMYMRNRFYDPSTGQFTQTDPTGLQGGLNGYGYAAGDPVNGRDPFGTECRRVSDENLRCTRIVPSDFTTIKNFLGGSAGAAAFTEFENAGWTQDPGCSRGGFTSAQCTALAEGISHLTLHEDRRCQNLGQRASRRLGAKLYRLNPGTSAGYNAAPFMRRVLLGDGIFAPNYLGTVASAVAHEEGHVKFWFRFLFTSSRMHNSPEIWNHPEKWDEVWWLGFYCGVDSDF